MDLVAECVGGRSGNDSGRQVEVEKPEEKTMETGMEESAAEGEIAEKGGFKVEPVDRVIWWIRRELWTRKLQQQGV